MQMSIFYEKMYIFCIIFSNNIHGELLRCFRRKDV